MLKHITVIIFFLFIITSSILSSNTPDTNEKKDYCQYLIDDLRWIHTTLKEHSSNYNYSYKNMKKYDREFIKIERVAKNCKTTQDYYNFLRSYIATYEDSHIGLRFLNNLEEQIYETGISPMYINKKFIIFDINPSLYASKKIKIGDEIIACNKQKILDFVINNLRYESYNHKAIESQLYISSPFALSQKNDKTLSCSFKNSKGFIFVEDLYLKPRNSNKYPQSLDRYYSNNSFIYKKEKTKYGAWIKFTRSYYRDEKELEQLKQFEEDAKSLKSLKNIVIDLRINDGGSSQWGGNWLKNPTGLESNNMEYNFIYTLLTMDNYNHFKALSERYIEENQSLNRDVVNEEKLKFDILSKHVGTFVSYSEKRNTCNSVKSPFLNHYRQNEKINEDQKKEPSLFNGKIYILTDHQCFSACETFVMMLKDIKNTIHVGMPTNASTKFSDIREVKNSDKRLSLMFPQKIILYQTGAPIVPDVEIMYDPELELEGKDSLRIKLEKIIEGEN